MTCGVGTFSGYLGRLRNSPRVKLGDRRTAERATGEGREGREGEGRGCCCDRVAANPEGEDGWSTAGCDFVAAGGRVVWGVLFMVLLLVMGC
jgi:hypothetical protein